MNIVSALIAISIMATASTTSVKTDIDTFVYNSRTTAPIVGACLPQFCYMHDAQSNGQTYMVFKITANVYGGNIIQRLKPNSQRDD
jgi:hypothetical protein